MPGKIIILPEGTIRKIAAGEVVERPASVVKELVENSIDALSSRIEIEIQEGGKKFIRVSDNGTGMSREDAELCLERHSTSKIKSLEDIYNTGSLGFRGEALPSIASVSIFELTTKARGASEGTRIKVDGGKDKKVESFGCAEGTAVIVKRLFHNVPARKKYLRASSTEASHIIDLISKLTLAYPEISFRLIHDGKEIISSPGLGEYDDSVASIYGSEVKQNLIKIKRDFDYLKITGYISKPNLTRIGRRDQSFFVNRRYVRNFLLSRSLEEAYRSLIPKDRSPIAIIFIEIDAKEIDVNVHPAKREIRFLKTNKVLDVVTYAVRSALGGKGVEAPLKSSVDYSDIEYVPQKKIREATEILVSELAEQVQEKTLEVDTEKEGKLNPLAQILNTYIVAQNASKLVLIDQHAAHERILFDKMKSKDFLRSQNLLIPETIELKPHELEMLEGYLEVFSQFGFDIEPFGRDSFLIRAVPHIVSSSNPKELFLGIVSELLSFGKSSQIEKLKDKMRALLACHGAVKAGDPLSMEEAKKLLLQLEQTENPSTCPHGRPTMVEISKDELERMFKRR